MAEQLRAGLTFEKTLTVDEGHTARHLAGKGIGRLLEFVKAMER